MKVIVDDKIPYIKGQIEQIARQVVYLPGAAITHADVKDADALIIRTRTRCGKELLEGSRVKFIATATIGYDHIDTAYCGAKHISWTNAPGCNSGSVAQYIRSSLLLLKKEKGMKLDAMCIGIVGVGNVGSKVCDVARSLNMKVLLNDPPRAERGELQSTPLSVLARECDIISFHTPLAKEGSHRSYHLADQHFFDSLKRKPVIINTSRGEVIDTDALEKALDEGKVQNVILDVWENEPDINLSLLKKVFIGTPHIAGYSADGKANATRMSLEALCRHFKIDDAINIAPPPPAQEILEVKNEEDAWLLMYNPLTDSCRLKENPERFEWFRGNYPLRREKEAYQIRVSTSSITRG